METEEGCAFIEKDRQFFSGKHHGQGFDTVFDQIIVQFCADKRQNMEMFFIDRLHQALVRDQ
jgi:hypothetical protein